MLPTLKALSGRSRAGWVLSALRDPLYRSSYALIANTAATTVVGIAYWATAAHFYNRQALGRSAALVSALILVSTLAQLNLANTLPRFIPKAGWSAGKFIAYSYGVSSCAALIGGLAFVTILPRLSSQWKFVSDSRLLAVTFVAAVVVWGVFALQDIALLSLRRPVLVPVENAVYGVCKLLMLIGVVSLLPSTGIFFSWVTPLVVTVPAVNWLIFRRYLKRRESAAAPSGLRTREIVRFASIDYVGSVLSQASGNLLPLLVLSTLGAAANSSFYIAWTIASGLGLVAANFGTSLLVEGAAAPYRLAELTRGVLARCLAITVLGAVLLTLAARPILRIYGSSYAVHSSTLLALLLIGTIPGSLVVVAVSLDRIVGHVGRATWTRLILTVLVLSSAWLLLRKVGIYGIAFAWGGANLVMALVRSPTILRAARRRPASLPMLSPVRPPSAKPRHAAGAGSSPLSLGRRAAGRHRTGAPRGGPMKQPVHLSHPLLRQNNHAPMPLDVRESDEHTTRAIQLLISLGTKVDLPSQCLPTHLTAGSGAVISMSFFSCRLHVLSDLLAQSSVSCGAPDTPRLVGIDAILVEQH
jgi:O-antigen/teichoic acid export membrane protein